MLHLLSVPQSWTRPQASARGLVLRVDQQRHPAADRKPFLWPWRSHSQAMDLDELWLTLAVHQDAAGNPLAHGSALSRALGDADAQLRSAAAAALPAVCQVAAKGTNKLLHTSLTALVRSALACGFAVSHFTQAWLECSRRAAAGYWGQGRESRTARLGLPGLQIRAAACPSICAVLWS